ncbi:maleate cis-trans isomerase family protein [Gordonia sputi]|uniref:maleate cis-trans isomerase family protein n=1 Tax=Gordonia sputi TaxID=36823 RepID=UPI0020439CA8|nr:maleate cis-trans isomerase [Gordonia sputi]MCM3895438.1 maleate cis-trans isomerase [Gordonia sputi]
MTTATSAVLYPGHAAEDDYQLIEDALDPSIRLPVVITEIDSDDHTVGAMRAVGESDRLLDGAQRARTYNPAALMWGCTSGSFLYGWEGAQQQAAQLSEAAGLPASSTSLAFAEACKALGIHAVAVAASYPGEVAAGFTTFLAGADIEVVGMRANDILTATDAGTIDGDTLFDMVVTADHPAAQAILIPDTALHTATWINDLEAQVGKPVLTANQVTAWEGARLAGATPHSDKLGALFSQTTLLQTPPAQTRPVQSPPVPARSDIPSPPR